MEVIKQLLLNTDHLWVRYGFSSRLFSVKDLLIRQNERAEAKRKGYKYYHNGLFREIL